MFTGWGLRASGLAATGCVAAFAFPAQAQDDTAALRAEIEALKKTITTLETRLEAVERKVEETPAATASASASPPISTAAPQQFAVRQPDVLRSPLPPRDTVGDELTGVARPDTRPPPNDPDLKGFLLIPGTDTMLRLGGFAKVNAIYDTAPAGNADKLVTSTIPVGAGGADNANIDANATRFSFEVRRPSILGPLRFYLENDFYGGSGSTAFRLRQAHGQVGNLYGGYGYSAFTDSDAFPDTLDDEGPGGEALLRLAALRYIWKVGEGATTTLSIEDPSSDLTLASGQRTFNQIPDVTLALRKEGGWGHVQAGAVLRSIGYEDVTEDRNELGYGLNASALIKVGGDFVMGAFTYGDGIARYFNDLGGKGYDAAIRDDGSLEVLTAYGGYLGYTHHWTPKWRSNLVGGAVVLDRSAWLEPTAFRSSGYGAVNLIWQGSPTLTVGVEALYGRLELQNGQDADVTRLQGSIKYNFVK